MQRRLLLKFAAGCTALLAFPRARSCEFVAATLTVHHPWTRATTPGADSAVLCMRIDEVTTDDRLVGVETPVAGGAEMAGMEATRAVDYVIPAGRVTELREDGTYVRLVQLRHPLEVGRSYPLTLVFEKSGTVQASLNVDFEAA